MENKWEKHKKYIYWIAKNNLMQMASPVEKPDYNITRPEQ